MDDGALMLPFDNYLLFIYLFSFGYLKISLFTNKNLHLRLHLSIFDIVNV